MLTAVAGALCATSDRAESAGVQELVWLMCRGRSLGGLFAVALVEAIDASCGIDELLFTCEERVASRTDFDVQITFAGRARLETFAARAGDRYFDIFGVNSWFHTCVIIGSAVRIVKPA